MLVSLMVKNLALIESAEVTFGKGLNILSGETGAGKSILMGSVNMALGGKVSRDVIRTGADYAYAELTFTAEPGVQKALADLDIYPEDGVYVFSRKLMGTRSICRINGESCSAAVMKQAGEYLLDIHGQNENHADESPEAAGTGGCLRGRCGGRSPCQSTEVLRRVPVSPQRMGRRDHGRSAAGQRGLFCTV